MSGVSKSGGAGSQVVAARITQAPGESAGEARAALKRMELFVAVLGHELRTPLTAIVAATELLDETEITPSQRQLLQRVETNARRMERMAAELRELCQIHSGAGLTLERSPCDLGALVAEARADVIVAHPAEVDVTVRGRCQGSWDRDRLAQVFSNLLGNAVAHSDDAKVSVAIDGKQARTVRVSVHSSAAIPPDVLPVIFDPFQRGPSSRHRGGLGLGLYISREIVVAHGGTIVVRSTAASGTTVIVSLPR